MDLKQASGILQAAGVISNPISAVTGVASGIVGGIKKLFGGGKRSPEESARNFQRDVLAELASSNPVDRNDALMHISARTNAAYLASVGPAAAAIYLETLDIARSRGLLSGGTAIVPKGSGATPVMINGVLTSADPNAPRADGPASSWMPIALVAAAALAFLFLRGR